MFDEFWMYRGKDATIVGGVAKGDLDVAVADDTLARKVGLMVWF